MAATVRYMVDDVDAAISFYEGQLGFSVEMHPGPGFAMLALGDLRLAVSAVGGAGGASQTMPDGRVPVPGGWNRIQLPVHDIEAVVQRLRSARVRFRNEIIAGMGGRQVLVDDPAGNCVELFEAN